MSVEEENDAKNVPNGVEDHIFSDFSKFIETIRCKFVFEEEFGMLVSNEDKIKYCLKNDSLREIIERFIVKNGNNSKPKSAEKARTLRIEGNKYFKNKQFEEALKYFSQALLEAPFPDSDCSSDELALAFANRSAIFFHSKKYKQCIQDVNNAIKYKYPSNQMHTMLHRKALCLKALGNINEAETAIHDALNSIPEDFPSQANKEERNQNKEIAAEDSRSDIKKLMREMFDSFDGTVGADDSEVYKVTLSAPDTQNAKLPSASSAVKLKYSKKKGRYLTVKRNVNFDETIIAEKPFVSVLNIQCGDQFCHHCCQELRYRLFPCKNCCDVQFCSEECYMEAYKTYHKFECDCISLIQSSGVVRLTLRILLSMGIDEIKKISKEPLEKACNQRQQLWDYKSILSLTDHSEMIPHIVSARQTLAACFYLLLVNMKMNLFAEENEDFYLIGSILLKHIQQVSCNSMVIFHQPLIPGPMDITGIDAKNQVIGTALYPTISLVNHSCLPNCDVFFNGSFAVLKARQPIQAGDEITVSYGALYRKMSRGERLVTLRSQYYFECDCRACSISEYKKDINGGMVAADAIYCNECRGPFVMSSETEGECVKCGTTAHNIGESSVCISNAKKLLNVGKALIQFGRVNEAEKQFQKALTYFNKVCYPNNRLTLSAYSELFYSNILLENFDEAKKYCEELMKTKKHIYGEDSPEYLSYCLQLINIKWAQHKKASQKSNASSHRINSMNKKLIQKLEKESDVAIEKTNNLLNSFKTCDSYVVLDSSLITCLKEVVEIQKMKSRSMK